MEYEEAYVGLNSLITNEPAYSTIYATIIEYCEEERWEAEAGAFADTLITKKHQLQSGPSLINILVRRGGLNRTIFVNDEIYEGTLEQLQSDEEVPVDAVIEMGVQASQAGLDFAKEYRRINSLEALFEDRPQYVEGFKIVLTKCAEKGCSTRELQTALQEAGVLKQGYADAQILHASYFTGKLETYGALVWDGDFWKATQKGVDALQ